MAHTLSRRILYRLFASLVGEDCGCGTRNHATREAWLERTLASIPAGSRILDAGAGELQYKRFCSHLQYVSQDFGQYDGQGDGIGLQKGSWDQSRLWKYMWTHVDTTPCEKWRWVCEDDKSN